MQQMHSENSMSCRFKNFCDIRVLLFLFAAAKPVFHTAAAAPAPALPAVALNPASAPALTPATVDTLSSAAAPAPAPAQLVAGVLP